MRSLALSNPYLSHLREDDEGGDVDQTLTLDTPCLVFGRYAQARTLRPAARFASTWHPQTRPRGAQLVDVNVRHESISRQHAALVHTETESFIQVPISALISA